MALTLFLVFQAFLLFANSVTILHEQRFLDKVGLSEEATQHDQGIKRQIAQLLKAIRLVMPVPLVIMNTLTMIALMLVG
ncbi:Immediate early response 3-interacting protein 1 [Porphyridium purpureum]|uniref:Immediate early response 3-interacting protein 1 n=1 Tax=Porphyridium purpureum TaxID=35688 RepID=A0A5J4YUN3_PORPP|nr:Immediate early response 3-interacting protein 1 [Porphyridium purpureum]KAA8498094.1 Immediate early response 3-interacting protein 1 [Porphyridium purpureum]|eukprot:POR4358..scf295_1